VLSHLGSSISDSSPVASDCSRRAHPTIDGAPSSQPPSVIVLGGGLSGMAAAYALARAGHRQVTVIERDQRLGGLAASFERGGHVYPLGYHHILHRDRTLLYFLDHLGVLPRVRWRRVRMLFERGDRLYDLAHPVDFLRFPLPMADKLRFVRLMAHAFIKRDWRSWNDRSAAQLIDRYASPAVREALFEPLTRLKFQLPCQEISAAWLGARLHYREGSAPLGYIPETNWTTALCDGMTALLAQAGVTVRAGRRVARLLAGADRIHAVELDDGTRLGADLFVSALPLETYAALAPDDLNPELRSIRYTALLSAICATDQKMPRPFYWMNLSSLRHSACGLFALSALNPTIGQPGETCLNFVTHLRRDDPMFQEPEAQILGRYRADFQDLFGFKLKEKWMRLVRVPLYSPVFGAGYRNPPVRSPRYQNLFFTGNYRVHPSVASTGTALGSGLETASAILATRGARCRIAGEVARFRPPRQQRAPR
jgi:protoporphyrinogen oxidase